MSAPDRNVFCSWVALDVQGSQRGLIHQPARRMFSTPNPLILETSESVTGGGAILIGDDLNRDNPSAERAVGRWGIDLIVLCFRGQRSLCGVDARAREAQSAALEH